jgi:alpha-ketoglutarate-dependent taurine dioxygenase
MKIERGPLHPSFGAEVVGVNLRHLDEETIAAIENGWTPTVSCSSATSG